MLTLVERQKYLINQRRKYERNRPEGSFERKNMRQFAKQRVEVRGKVHAIQENQVTIGDIYIKDVYVDHVNFFLDERTQKYLQILEKALKNRIHVEFNALVTPYFSKGRRSYGFENVKDLRIARNFDTFRENFYYFSSKPFLEEVIVPKFLNNGFSNVLAKHELRKSDTRLDFLADGITFVLKKKENVMTETESKILNFLPQKYKKDGCELELLLSLHALKEVKSKRTSVVDKHAEYLIAEHLDKKSIIQETFQQVYLYKQLWDREEKSHHFKYESESDECICMPIIYQKGEKREFLLVLPQMSKKRSNILRQDGLIFITKQAGLKKGDVVTLYNPILNREFKFKIN